ncbi:MAG: LptF/LptG family permease [Verrucomicrobiales bacterium]|nr:LptF/LptG family permease [Verrucomicrobiales bacterium]
MAGTLHHMAYQAPTRSPLAPDWKQRLRSLFLLGLDWIRRVPWLTSAAALAGVVTLCVLTRMHYASLISDTPAGLQQQYRMALDGHTQHQFVYDFFLEHWKLGALLLLPAFVQALLRLRGLQLALPLTLATLALLSLWLVSDLHYRLDASLSSSMGEQPVPEAYYIKLGLIAAAILSLPILFLLYQRSSLMDKYVVRHFLPPFLLCLLGIIGIMITMDLLDNANDFLKAGFGPSQVGAFYLTQLPQILVMITDVAVLLATLFTLSRMSRFNEIISMLGSGRSLVRVLLPLIVVGLWSSLIILAMNYEWAPAAQNVKDAMLRNADKSELRRRREQNSTYNVFYRNREENRFWYHARMSNSMAAEADIGLSIVVQDDGKGNLIKAWYGRKAAWVPQHREWRFYDAHVVDPAVIHSEKPEIPGFDRLSVEEHWTETPWSILSGKINPEFLSVQELASYLKTNEGLAPEKLAKYEATLQSRFSLPFRCLIMVLIGAPLAVVSSRRGVLGGIATAVTLFVILFFSYTLALKAGERSVLPPAVSAWVVILAFALLGIGLLWMRNYNRSLPSLNPFRRTRRPAAAQPSAR